MYSRLLLTAAVALVAAGRATAGGDVLLTDVSATARLDGGIGRRLHANVRRWLVPAPEANPGMTGMLRVRDRKPTPAVVPWAGEFAGKYLLSAIPVLRMSGDPALMPAVRGVVEALLAAQAPDGYLGPFPRDQRLLGNWDLWGHYHLMLGLIEWHRATGDLRALAATRRAADLVCRTYLGGKRRVYDAGSHEMNMAIAHALARLYRLTREPRYLKMTRAIVKDWERAGDYLRTGLAGTEFFRTPRPRWESLPDLQALAELYRITGDTRYRTALVRHWWSIRRWDVHDSGAFSTNEQAVGDPYASGAIETCCTTAWMALSIDMLRLTGDPAAADALETATLNAVAASQHPSGRWWTYHTPMDGVREASAHAIVFQARAGTPELNCCSVNGPRGLAMLAEWAVMRSGGGLAVSWYGPGAWRVRLRDGTPVRLETRTAYPADGDVRIAVMPTSARRFALRLRIPGWAEGARLRVNGGVWQAARAGAYRAINRTWRRGDRVELSLPMRVRWEAGDRAAAGKVSVYRGPLLLAYDQGFNAFDEGSIPALTARDLRAALVVPPRPGAAVLRPWILLEVRTGGRALRLCDFASAGAGGTRYRSWLAMRDPPPPRPILLEPAEGAAVAPGAVRFRWSGLRRPEALAGRSLLRIADNPAMRVPVARVEVRGATRAVVAGAAAARLAPGRRYWWTVTAANAHGAAVDPGPPRSFVVDPRLPPVDPAVLEPAEGPGGLLVHAPLTGAPEPAFGRLLRARGWAAAAGTDGQVSVAVREGGMLVYAVDEFPDEEYTAMVRVLIERLPEGRVGQVLSAWCVGMDDPLRVCVESGRIRARIEAGQGYDGEAVPIEPGRWRHVAVVKRGSALALYLDGQPVARGPAPAYLRSASRAIALGGNPCYAGDEHLDARFADFRLYGRALTEAEIARAAARHSAGGVE